MCISFEEARRAPMLQLSVEQEALFAWQERRDPNAAETLIRSHARLVHSIARRWSRSKHDLDDLVSAGMVGLLRAANEYKAEHSARFSTYARWWIMTMICNEVAVQRTVLSIPPRRYHDMIGGRLTDEDADLVRAAVDQVVGLDAPVAPDREDTLGEMLPSSEPSPEEQLVSATNRQDLRELLDLAISSLKSPAREVMCMRAQEIPETYAQIAQTLDMPESKVRMVEKSAHMVLRRTLAERGLAPSALLC